MKLSKKATRTVTVDVSHTFEPEADTETYSDGRHPDYDAETGAEFCPVCHDLLAWHEQACEAAPAPQVTAESEGEAPAFQPQSPVSIFAFAIGHLVQPADCSPAAITWRGQHKERHPATGLVHRINVYYLDNGYWDCYREDELQAA